MKEYATYHPSKSVSEYIIGDYYWFCRNNAIAEAQKCRGNMIPFVEKNIETGGKIGFDNETGGKIGLDNGTGGKIGLDNETGGKIGWDFNPVKKEIGVFSYELGQVIGTENGLSVRFHDTPDGYCERFVTSADLPLFGYAYNLLQDYGN